MPTDYQSFIFAAAAIIWVGLLISLIVAACHFVVLPRLRRWQKRFRKSRLDSRNVAHLDDTPKLYRSADRTSLNEMADGSREFNYRHYFAFVSYAHADKTFATWVRRELEAFKLHSPIMSNGIVVPEGKLDGVFQDDVELGAAADLGNVLRDALDASQNLIVICSSHSAQSRWVNEEIRHFRNAAAERNRNVEAQRIGAAKKLGRILAIVANDKNRSSRDVLPGLPAHVIPPALLEHIGSADSSLIPTAIILRRGRHSKSRVIANIVASGLGISEQALAKDRSDRMSVIRTLVTIGVFAIVGIFLLFGTLGGSLLKSFGAGVK